MPRVKISFYSSFAFTPTLLIFLLNYGSASEDKNQYASLKRQKRADPLCGRLYRERHNLFPWHFYLTTYWDKKENHIFAQCSAVLINERILITSASCLMKEHTYGQASRSIEIILSSSDAKMQSEVFSKFEVCIHYLFGRPCDPVCYNLALIRLADTLKLKKSMNAICLPELNFAIENYVTVSGWGQTAHGTVSPKHMLYSDLPVQSVERCLSSVLKNSSRATRRNVINIYKPLTLCLKNDHSGRICKPHLGSAIMMVSRNDYYLVGISSSLEDKDCENLSLHSRLTNDILKWIMMIKNTGIKNRYCNYRLKCQNRSCKVKKASILSGGFVTRIRIFGWCFALVEVFMLFCTIGCIIHLFQKHKRNESKS